MRKKILPVFEMKAFCIYLHRLASVVMSVRQEAPATIWMQATSINNFMSSLNLRGFCVESKYSPFSLYRIGVFL